MMKTRSILLIACAFVLLASGCNDPVRSRLTGTWKLDVTIPEQNSPTPPPGTAGEDKPVDESTAALIDGVGGGDQDAARMLVVFHADRTLETITDFGGTGSRKTWQWSTESWDESTGTAVIRCVRGEEATSTRIHFLDPDTIELVPPNLDVLKTTLRFRRQQDGSRNGDAVADG